MNEVSTSFLNLLARPPGDLFYFLLVFLIVIASFGMAVGQRLRIQDRASTRYALAALGVLVAWCVVLLGQFVAVLLDQPVNVILPPLERAVQVVIALVIGWAFLTADHERFGRGSNLLLLALLWGAVIGYVATGIEWSAPSARDTTFNLTAASSTWALTLVAISVAGAVLTLANIRLIFDAPLKVVFFALLAFGSVATLSGSGALEGDYAGILRLAFLGALLVVPAVLYRLTINRLELAVQTQYAAQSSAPLLPVQPVFTPAAAEPSSAQIVLSERDSAPLMKALGMMLEDSDPDAFPRQVVSAVCSLLKADVGALLTVQDANFADVVYSYNKLLARPIDTFSVSLTNQPTLVNAIERQTQRPLLPDRNEDELLDLYSRFDIEQRGPTYFQPLVRRGRVLAVLMIGMPYTGRELTLSEQETLRGVGIIGANLLAVSEAAREARVKAEGRIVQAMVRNVPPDSVSDAEVVAAWENMQQQLEAARDQIVQLSRQVTELKLELDDERSRVTSQLGDTEEGLSATGRIIALTEEQQRLLEERDKLHTRLREAEAMLAQAMATGDQGMFQAMIDALNREKDDLVRQRESLQQELQELRGAGGALLPGVVRDMIERMSAEKARLEEDRSRLMSRLAEIEGQLQAFGVEGGAEGLAATLATLYAQKAQYEALRGQEPGSAVVQEGVGTSDEQVERLRADLARLAADREALMRQRDQLKNEKDELASRFDALKEQRARVMAEAAAYQQELTEAHVQQAQMRVLLQRQIEERTELLRLRDTLLAEKTALETERDQLLARVEGDRDRLLQLGQDGVGSLTDMINRLTAERAKLERDLGQAAARLADLENELNVARIHASTHVPAPDRSLADQIAGLVQEFRTPMTAIVGYVDLVLNESAGILGDLQRRFMQRVASNVKRLWMMTDDIYWLTQLDTGRFELTRTLVDVVGVIEDSVTSVTPQLREKELTITLDLDDELPPIEADQEAITEVIGQVLTNAYLVSPAGGSIGISARHQRLRLPRGDINAQPQDVLVVAVRDSGPGIAPEDEAFVFMRRYKLENPLIPGLGDTGVGLSIAKSLLEAHGGEIWLETGSAGTTLLFALPYHVDAELVSDRVSA